jgi:hypothetical protein
VTSYPEYVAPDDERDIEELAHLRDINAKLLAACEEWTDYFDQLDARSEPGDRLAEFRREFHGARLARTKSAIAFAKGERKDP